MSLREWAPLTDLFNRLPTKIQNGLFTYDIKLTCVDILPEFIALGTNFGLVYWYDRKKKDLQKLRCENTNAAITVVKIINTVDYMVASGNVEGNISIFQVPKSHPESLPENLRPKKKQIERYTVSELHNAAISALEWSKNGMKLFSGDKKGYLVLTEIDFYMHLCKSSEILNESYEVVQLSYHQQHLLVSTTYRSIIYKKEDKWKVSQIGKKDRKVLGDFGGTFYQNSLRPNDVVLYCTRPGLRIWMADVQGNVEQTLLFKDILNRRSPEAQLINPVSKNLRKLLPQKESSFGVLKPFDDHLLVTHSNDVVYVLDPKELTVTTMVSHLRKVLSVAVHKDEIFILEGERSLIRLSERPEIQHDSIPSILTASSFLPITTSIKDLTNKLQSSSVISAIPTLGNDFNIHTDDTSIINAEEAQESPKKMGPPQLNKLKIYDKISTQRFDDAILFKHKRKKKMNPSILSWSSHSSDEPEGTVSKPTQMNTSTFRILPDLRSPDSIKHDIEYKETLLANVLRFDKISLKTQPVEDTNDDVEVEVEKHVVEERNEEVQEKFSESNDFVLQPFGTIMPEYNGVKSSDTIKWEHRSPTSSSDSNLIGNALDSNRIQYDGDLPRKSFGNKKWSMARSSLTNLPVCMNIPTEWELQNVMLNVNDMAQESNLELSGDWEII